MNNYLLYPGIDWFIAFIASFLIWIMVSWLLFYGLVKKKISQKIIIYTLLSCILSWLVSEIIKSFIPSLRPFKVNGYPPLTFTVPESGSFPSSHTASAFAIAFYLLLKKKKEGIFFLAGALFVAVGRVLANVHYVTDILAGILLGTTVAFLVSKLDLSRLNKKFK